jgi:hypothetical protein
MLDIENQKSGRSLLRNKVDGLEATHQIHDIESSLEITALFDTGRDFKLAHTVVFPHRQTHNRKSLLSLQIELL